MNKAILKFLIFILVPITASLVTLSALLLVFSEPADKNQTQVQLIEVTPDASFKQIANSLKEKNIIKYVWAFSLIAKLRGKDRAIMAGEYELSPAMSPEKILDTLVSGKMHLRKVTLKEGVSIWELGDLLQEAAILDKMEIEPLLTNPVIIKELGIPGSSLEGYLFPETYQFPKGISARKVIEAMNDEFSEHWTGEYEARAKELGFTKHEIVTLASIIEKETGKKEEMPRVSSVFHNRLKKEMRLQADPTVIYGIANYDGNIRKEDLTTPSPYNTYVILGLPPGPIANPGADALRAALYPSATNNLYFVADGSGNHFFSATLEEHNRAVSLYQKGNRTP